MNIEKIKATIETNQACLEAQALKSEFEWDWRSAFAALMLECVVRHQAADRQVMGWMKTAEWTKHEWNIPEEVLIGDEEC